jgi:hypothetical protein
MVTGKEGVCKKVCVLPADTRQACLSQLAL